MRLTPGAHSGSPFTAAHPYLRVVDSIDPDEGADRDPPANTAMSDDRNSSSDAMPENASLLQVIDDPPVPIRWIAKLIARIRWLPIAWHLLCSIPSEMQQAWHMAFNKQE